MSEFGCFYNPRPAPGRCIKDVRSTTVESQCEIVDNTCRLTGSPKSIVVPTSVSSIKSTVSLADLMKTDVTNSTLSGPVSAYAGTYSDTNIYLFGDVHFSLENECSGPCKSVDRNLRDVNPPGSTSCWDMPRLLTDMFTSAAKKGEMVDFYVEIPFLPGGNYQPTKDDIYGTVSSAGELYKLYYIFYDCFHKYNCKFGNVRFHYSDVRLQYTEANYDEMMQMMQSAMNLTVPQFDIKQITFEGYIEDRINKSINILGNMMVQNIRTPDKYIYITDIIIKHLYYSGGQTMTGTTEPLNVKLFRLYLTSDNYVNDITEASRGLLDELASNEAVTEPLLALIEPTILTNRRGKNMHRVRAQLEALENEGNEVLSNEIKQYIINRYITAVDNNTLMKLWDKFMALYKNYINPKFQKMGDENIALEELKRDYGNLMQILNLSVSSTSLLMDAYILGRMFRKFPTKRHELSKTNIVYAGASHIESYTRFFRSVMGVPLYEYGSSLEDIMNMKLGQHNRCIDVNIDRFL